MKAKLILKVFFYLVLIGLCFTHCTTSKHLNDGQYLLSKNSILLNQQKVKNKEVYQLLKQKPNKQFLGIAPIYLFLYNIAEEENKGSWFKKIGEAPVLLNYRLARKSASQIELHYKNLGYLDSKVTFEIAPNKHKAKAIYSINNGSLYKINEVNISSKTSKDLTTNLSELLNKSRVKKGKTYNFKTLEAVRSDMALKLQNRGYYQFNKEFIHFIADTNQHSKQVNLTLVVDEFEKNVKGTILQENHKLGVIGTVNVHLETKPINITPDTIVIQGINFIFNGSKPSFNLNRLAEKILLRPYTPYNKNFVDKSYKALSELKNFKKISFEFSPINSDQTVDVLRADIYVVPGKKIAYTLEAEATTNPELKEGISGSASLGHYNIFKGAEHLQLTYKGSSNFSNIKENGLIVNLTIPSLISPIKLNKILNKNTRTRTIFTASFTEQQRPEFTRNSILGSYKYQWKTRENFRHKLALFNLSYVNFQGDSTDLSSISEYLIAKDYSNHLIPTSSYTLSFNDQNINKLKNHSYFRVHIESSGSILNSLAKPLNFQKLKDEDGNPILKEDGSPSYTLNLWNQENIFTQYIKTSIDFRHYWEIDRKNSVAFRAMGGIIYAYGNTTQAPFHKKFVAGGANDLRGWRAFKRPTGMLSTTDTLYTGGVKLISSFEYRFNVIKKLKGAVFIDAGNIWEIEQNNNKYEEANFHWNDIIDEIAANVGFGLRYDFQYFILRTDLGFPVREPNQSLQWQWDKITLKDSQLNIGLGYPF